MGGNRHWLMFKKVFWWKMDGTFFTVIVQPVISISKNVSLTPIKVLSRTDYFGTKSRLSYVPSFVTIYGKFESWGWELN